MCGPSQRQRRGRQRRWMTERCRANEGAHRADVRLVPPRARRRSRRARAKQRASFEHVRHDASSLSARLWSRGPKQKWLLLCVRGAESPHTHNQHTPERAPQHSHPPSHAYVHTRRADIHTGQGRLCSFPYTRPRVLGTLMTLWGYGTQATQGGLPHTTSWSPNVSAHAHN